MIHSGSAPSGPHSPTPQPAGWLRLEDCRLEDLQRVLDQTTVAADYPFADAVEQGVLLYDGAAARGATRSRRRELQTELARALSSGPGIVVFQGAFDADVVDRVTAAFDQILADQRITGKRAGDHFAKPGANDRIWNALEKLAIGDPEAFTAYYASDVLAMVATAWLGPGYQITSQVNVVNPGGAGQTAHRDYHLGFQSPQTAAAYPKHVHALSPTLTLQGAVAHCDMPVESGPTLYLPHSQKYDHGYLAYWRDDFQEFFGDHHVQLPLAKGDAVFFNPALFHAAGSNRSSTVHRMANLLQVSSAFGRAMESVDRSRISLALYPALLRARAEGMSGATLTNVVAASAEGYAFPTNLDRDQPTDGMTPPSQADVVTECLRDGVAYESFSTRLAAVAAAKLSH